jgi:phosphoglycerate dehydrogenase-like enzyme
MRARRLESVRSSRRRVSSIVSVVLASRPVHRCRNGKESAHVRIATRPCLSEADVLYTQRIAPDRVAAAQRLRWVQTFGAGVEWLLTPNLRQREDLVVTNASGIHAQPIAEHVFGLVLMFARQLHRAARQQAARSWHSEALQPSVTSLSGATLGIVGLGAIGRRISAIAGAFGMRVTALTRTSTGAPGVERVFGPGQLVPFLKEAEYVVNTLPLT